MVLQGIQLHVEVKDFDNETVNTYDSVDDDLIDSFSVDSGSRTTIGSSVTVTKVGTYRYGMLGLTATILCAQFFYGDQCQLTELCEPNGTCIEIKINDCEGQNCSGNGQCVNSYTCVCSPGYTGTYCETNINDCKDQNCSRNGICIDRVDSFLCECYSGFTGTNCETDINDCMGQDCSGNGVCVDGMSSYSCTCRPGFTGSDCGTNINECEGQNCSGNGRCLDGINLYNRCDCDPDFMGPIVRSSTTVLE